MNVCLSFVLRFNLNKENKNKNRFYAEDDVGTQARLICRVN